MFFDQEQIAEILPQKYPFLMIDRVVDFKKDESLTAIKNITGNEWCSHRKTIQSNHFPETLLIEAAAQAAIAFCLLNDSSVSVNDGIFALAKAKSEFYEQVYIGDTISIKTGQYRIMSNNGFMNVGIHVDTKLIADLKIFFSLIPVATNDEKPATI